MSGLMHWVNWRTFLTGFVVGYFAAWGMHWATTLYTFSGSPVHHPIPVFTLFEKK
jgi:hypothetical protein